VCAPNGGTSLAEVPEEAIHCTHGNQAYSREIGGIHLTQAGLGRHRCAVCAFAEGSRSSADSSHDSVACAEGTAAPEAVLRGLPESQAGEGRHRCVICAFALGKSRARMDPTRRTTFPDEEVGGVEGALLRVTINVYERDPALRIACIEKHGTTCVVCGFNFAKVYGDIGRDFIHVHHLVALGGVGRAHRVDPVRDLCPVCPNCHAMLHQQRPPLSVDELKQRLR